MVREQKKMKKKYVRIKETVKGKKSLNYQREFNCLHDLHESLKPSPEVY